MTQIEMDMDGSYNGPEVWLEKTLVKRRIDRTDGPNAMGKALWSPQTGKDGRDTYATMRQVKPNDIVLHLIDNDQITGMSVVAGPREDDKVGLADTEWAGRRAYRYPLKGFTLFNPPLMRSDFLDDKSLESKLHEIRRKHEGSGRVFFNKKLELNQGSYLTSPPPDLISLWNEIYQSKTGKVLFKDPRPYKYVKTSVPVAKTELERFDINHFLSNLEIARLQIQRATGNRLVSSLLSKPFLILTGLSGSGKTKLAQAFAQWLSAGTEQYLVVPVGADWTSREPMFGYPSALDPTKYVQPDSGVLKLLLHATDHSSLPHFLILDEMNLSHVERYFADFLSGLESGDELSLHSNTSKLEGVPAKLRLPKNLFIIGTVNIDETTYMFSPKVLDRANVIEFRVSREEMGGFLANPVKPDLDRLKGLGASMGADFVVKATEPTPYSEKDGLNVSLLLFFAELKKCGAEFGYRSANEIHGLAGKLKLLNPDISLNEVVDIALMQKLLPKVHGSRKKMEKILKVLAGLCTTDSATAKTLLEKDEFALPDTGVKYPMALEKLWRMYRGAVDNGFTSYAEA